MIMQYIYIVHHLLSLQEDYLVLHKLVTQYVQGFDTYANFQ